ncbi:MAG TPA: hypothetical protein VI670_25110 [Thermoanaerobaculia bacterium]|jgi:hypothetical protein
MKWLDRMIHPVPPSAWKIGAIAALILVAVAALALAVRRLWPKWREAIVKRDRALLDAAAKAASIQAAVTELKALVNEASAQARQAFAQSSAGIAVLPGELQPVAQKVELLRDDLAALRNEMRMPSFAAPPPAQAADVVTMEREALKESWRIFRKNAELSASFDAAIRDDGWQSIQHPLLVRLPKVVPDDLKPTYDAAVAPVREFHNLVTRFALIPRLVSDEVPRLDTAQEVARTREAAQMLTLSSTLVGDRLNFRVRSWITETFLSFADLFLRKYQQAQLEKRASELEEGHDIVRQVLRVAAVDPIDVTLGETTFDSTRHVGRSTANDPRFSDGVIVDVIRNGFVENGQQVIRQPEVVVNRMR